MVFEQVFDNLTVKHTDALRKQIQSLVDYVLKHCFWIARSPNLFALISTRGITHYVSLFYLDFRACSPDCSGCKVSGLQHGATIPSTESFTNFPH